MKDLKKQLNGMKTTIVIPLHNEKKHAVKLLEVLAKYKLPIVVVDDGSVDGSGDALNKLKINGLKILKHEVNLGKGSAMKTGAEYAFNEGAGAIIFMDADGQHDPKDLPKFIEKLNKEKKDIVFGTRTSSLGVPLVRFLGNKFASVVVAMFFGKYISDCICGFRALTKNAYNKIKWESSGYGVEIEMIARMPKRGLTFAEVPVETIYHDHVKGVTMLNAISIMFDVVKWKLTL